MYRRAVALMTEVRHQATNAAGVALEDVDLFVYHQANGRILGAVASRLGLARDRVVDYVGRHASTAAAALPIALATADQEGRLRPGMCVLLAAFGAGLVWGEVVMEWR